MGMVGRKTVWFVVLLAGVAREGLHERKAIIRRNKKCGGTNH